MKTQAFIVSTLMGLLCLFSFSSCSSDDSDSESGKESEGLYAANSRTAYIQCPDDNHPHAIDMGLPSGTKWACCNVGASEPTAFGNYYAWGETEPKSIYNGETYSVEGIEPGTDIAGSKYDVAHVKWGGTWQMPSKTQFEELKNKSDYEVTTQNEVRVLKVTGPSGATIYLPAAGRMYGKNLEDENDYGYYWLFSMETNDTEVIRYYPCFTAFHGPDKSYPPKETWGFNRYSGCWGHTIRPICL